jgi:hypothetical protein
MPALKRRALLNTITETWHLELTPAETTMRG